MAWSYGHEGGKTMGFFLGEYGGKLLVSFWEFDLSHSCFSSQLSGYVGFADVYCSEFPIQLLEFVDGGGYVFSLEVVDEVFIGIDGFVSDVLLGEEVGMGWGCGCASLYDLICPIVVWGSVCVVWDIDCPLCPVDCGVNFF